MVGNIPFQGKIVRLERDGFGIVEFDHVIGANTHGVFSTSVSSLDFPFGDLKQGMHVSGTAEIDNRDVAAVKTLQLESSS